MKLDRRQFFLLSSGALAAAPFGRMFAQAQSAAPAQTPPAPPVTAFADVRRNVGIFTGRGGTVGFLINKDAVTVIDTQYPDTAKICLAGVKQKSGGRAIDVVFNTHHHGDHTLGNPVFRPDAKKIVAQAGVPQLQRTVAASTPDSAPVVVADTTFDRTWSQKFGDETIAAQYNGPGHTGADALFHFERADVVHMGDLLFLDRHPRVDRGAGASIRNWITILEKVAKGMPADTIYIAGHAKDAQPATADRAALLRFRDYFDAVLTLTRKGIAGGQSKDAIAATPELPGFGSYQGGGALTLKGVLEVAYDELTAKG
jgi:glyoxylase-like metal-dependent hydrolase (beta-lactamase superfamily II)